MFPSHFFERCSAALLLLLLLACTPRAQRAPEFWTYDRSRLPPADLALNIANLGPATDAPDRSLRLCSSQPVVVLVHGCNGSAGLFRALAEVFAFHGQQVVAFSYNDRDSLQLSANQLNTALGLLATAMQGQAITLIGHSQGGLIARRALVAPLASPAKLQLVTISAPFSGIRAADHCGSKTIKILSLGIVIPICQAVTGSKWREITRRSAFMLEPGMLDTCVQSHLMIRTDERDSCRHQNAQGQCVSSDFVFSLEEQTQGAVEMDARVRVQLVKAGHVEIVGDHRVAPRKLIQLLQEEGIMARTEAKRMARFEALLAGLYGEN